jgi:cholesterol oxidase
MPAVGLDGSDTESAAMGENVTKADAQHFDWIIVGSGFGGSVSALRLVEKGYKVLVVEKGRRFEAEDFPKTNWDLRRWMWKPEVGMKGIFQMSFLEHVTVMHGVGVGGGSLVYANTLPTPSDGFFDAESWSHLSEGWKEELEPHYATARRMLGATEYPNRSPAEDVLEEIAEDIGRAEHFENTTVGVYFGEPGVEVDDPYFDGQGPTRTGCIECGACMTGCRYNAKNTLDRNYLWLAENQGLQIEAETEVTAVRPRPEQTAQGGGYVVETRPSLDRSKPERTFTADRVIFSGGVMGTVPLLLKLREDPDGLPSLSARVGDSVRTNNEALLGVIQPDAEQDITQGVAITSILHTDEHSHLEPVRYGAGSGFFRLLGLPHAPGSNVFSRLAGAAAGFLRQPLRWTKAMLTSDWASHTQILLYMRTLESTLSFRLGRSVYTGFRKGLVSTLDNPDNAPSAFMEEATDLAKRWADKVSGVAMGLLTETVMGTPSTAHILGGACMGDSTDDGVIDVDHRVHGYDGLYVIDGSAISANPGVNPSLTITALAERAMSKIEPKAQQ